MIKNNTNKRIAKCKLFKDDTKWANVKEQVLSFINENQNIDVIALQYHITENYWYAFLTYYEYVK